MWKEFNLFLNKYTKIYLNIDIKRHSTFFFLTFFYSMWKMLKKQKQKNNETLLNRIVVMNHALH